MKNYLTKRKQRCRVGNSFSRWRTITSGVPQGSIFGPWLLNIFVNDIFFAKNSTLCNYADDNAQFSWEKTFNQVINNLQTDFRKLLKVWSYDNFLVLNPNQCHFMTLGNGYNIWNFAQDDIIIKNSLSEIILGLTIGNILDFSGHISNICRSVNQKLNALFRVSANMNSNKCKLLINSFINPLNLVLLFYTPWKHQKTFRFFDVFEVYRKAIPGCNG